MKTSKAHTGEISKESAEEMASGLDNPDLVILYLTIEHSEKEAVHEFVEGLYSELDARVVGVSVSGFMTDSTDYLMTQGAVAVGLSDADFSINRLGEDPWTSTREKVIETFRANSSENSLNMVFDAGPRQSDSSEFWDRVKSYAVKLMEIPGVRDRMIDGLNERLIEQKAGYPFPSVSGLDQLAREGHEFFVNRSTDGGELLKGCEVLDGSVYWDEGWFNLRLDEEVELKQTVSTSDEDLEELEVVREFTDLKYQDNVVYKMDGKTLKEIKNEVPVAHRLGKGGFSYYAILVMEEERPVVALGDIDLIGTGFPVDDLEKVLIVRSPTWEDYRETVREEIKQFNGEDLFHLNVHSSKLTLFQNNTGLLGELVNDLFEDWLIVIGANFTMTRDRNYLYPTALSYRE